MLFKVSILERSFVQDSVLDFLWEIMCCEDVLLALCLFLLAVERLKECRDFMYGVVGPLQNVLTEECGAGTCAFCMLLGGQRFFLHEGQSVLAGREWLTWDFDATRRFPVEDIYLL